MKKGLGKRGDYELYFFIFMLIMTGIVVLALFQFQQRAADSEALDQLFISRDVALLLDALFAAPGNVVYTYDTDKLEQFSYSFDKRFVDLGAPGRYGFAGDKAFTFNPPSLQAPSKIYFSNDDYEFRISDSGLPPRPLYKYPHVGTAVAVWDNGVKNIVVESNAQTPEQREKVELFKGNIPSARGVSVDIFIFVEFVQGEQVEMGISAKDADVAARSRKLASLLANDIITRKNIPVIIYPKKQEKIDEARDAGLFIRMPISAVPPHDPEGALKKALIAYYSS